MALNQSAVRRLSIVLAAAALCFAGVTAWKMLLPRAGCADCGSSTWTPREHLSPEFNDAMTLLYASNRKRDLDDDESALVVDSIRRHSANLPWQYATSALSPAEEEASHVVGYCYALIGERLRYGGIAESWREQFASTAIAGLESSNPRERLVAIAAVCYGRLVADPAVRARIVALQSDDVQIVRDQAVRQLAHHDKIVELERAGRWSEPSPRWRR